MVQNSDDSVISSMLVVANIFNTLKITKLSVPDLVQANTSAVILDCELSVPGPEFKLQWFFNGDKSPVYEWSPFGEPVVQGLLEGRIDGRYKVSTDPLQERRALRLLEPTPELSGDYTCVLTSGADRDEQTATMLVFSPEQEFSLSVQHSENDTNISCVAKGVYPQPMLSLEVDQQPVPKQESRVWRSEGVLYDAASVGWLVKEKRKNARVLCKLHLPHAGYSAIREEIISGNIENHAATYHHHLFIPICLIIIKCIY